MIDPDATPEEKFRAWLDADYVDAAPRRWEPSRAERWRANTRTFLALAGVLAVVMAIVWWRGWR